MEFILHGMKLRQSCVQDDCLQVVQDEWWPYNVADVCDFCIWSIYLQLQYFFLHCICIVFF